MMQSCTHTYSLITAGTHKNLQPNTVFLKGKQAFSRRRGQARNLGHVRFYLFVALCNPHQSGLLCTRLDPLEACRSSALCVC